MIAMRWLILILIFAAPLLSTSCHSGCDAKVAQADWSYIQRREWKLSGPVCVSELRYRNQHVWAGRRLITPIGTFEISVSQHGNDDHGWRRVSPDTTAVVPMSSTNIPPDSLSRGFYPSAPDRKPQGIPGGWIYIGGVEQPGWASPAKLRDLSFIRQHPPRQTRIGS